MTDTPQQPPEEEPNPYASPAESPEAQFSRFSIADLLGLTALVAVNFGAWAYEPGVGFLVSILSVPVAIRSLLLFKRRAALGLPTSHAQKAAYLGGSLLTAVVIYLLLSAALFATFFAACFALLAGESRSETQALVIPLAALAVAIPVGALWIAIRWMRSRWRRDTADPSKPRPPRLP